MSTTDTTRGRDVDDVDLLERLEPPERRLLERCGQLAQGRGERAFLVGGSVRDLVLERRQTDLDVVVEGDGMALAQALARDQEGTLTRHHAFQTARVDTPDGLRVDVATARREDYPRPGQLPQVVPGTLEDDLWRRDFTINTMAIDLSPGTTGELVDPLDGIRDLEAGVIRVIHSRSFADDPTRVLRALRFAMRFDYRLDDETESGLDESVAGGYLDTVSGERLRRELEQMFTEFPVQGPVRLERKAVLAAVGEGLVADSGGLERLQEAASWWAGVGMQGGSPAAAAPGWTIVLAGCARSLAQQGRWELVRRLKLSRKERRPLIDSGAPWAKVHGSWRELGEGGALANSQIERIFRPLSPAVLLLAIAFDAVADGSLGDALRIYLEELQWIRPELDGSDLRELGVPEGPGLGEMLDELRAARLDARVSSADEERQLVAARLATEPRG